MKDTEFLEKLLRLAWKNGYESFNFLSTNHGWSYKMFQTGSGHFVIGMLREMESAGGVNIERFIFDHDFIKTLYELLPNRLLRSDIQDYTGILARLACSNNRIEYLRKEFEGLIE